MKRADVALVGTHVSAATGYGGVAESLYNLVVEWARRGRSIRLCVSDGSEGARITSTALELPSNVKLSLYHAMFFKRWGFGPGAVLRVLTACRMSHVVYVCGIGTWPTTLAALFCTALGRPFVVSPRGGLMFRHVADIKARKPWKWLFYKTLTLPTLRAARFIHVTSLPERDGVLALLPNAKCELVVNGLDTEAWPTAEPRRQQRFTLCYIGRISEEKGTNRFARVWLSVHQQGERMVVGGEGVGEYAKQLRALAATANGAIQLLGQIDRALVQETLARSDFLVLPSAIEGDNERENFGNAVAEALATGRPVLVTKGLAWDFVETAGIGFTFERNDGAISVAIEKARGLSVADYERMCRTARNYAENNLRIGAAADRLWSVVQHGATL